MPIDFKIKYVLYYNALYMLTKAFIHVFSKEKTKIAYFIEHNIVYIWADSVFTLVILQFSTIMFFSKYTSLFK